MDESARFGPEWLAGMTQSARSLTRIYLPFPIPDINKLTTHRNSYEIYSAQPRTF